MDGILVPYLPTALWVFSAAVTILVLLVYFGHHLHFRNRRSALIQDEKTAATLAAKIAIFEADEKAIRESIQIQKSELDRLISERETQEKLRAHLADLDQQCATKEEECRSLRKDAGELENQLHTHSERLESLKKEASTLEEKSGQADQIEKRLRDNEMKLEEMNTILKEGAVAKIEFEVLLQKRAALESQIDQLKNDLETAKIETNTQIEMARQAQQDASEIKEKVNLEKRKNEDLEFKNAKLATTMAELKTKIGDLDAKREEAEVFEKRLTELNEKAADAKSELLILAREEVRLQNLIGEKGTLETKIEDLKAQKKAAEEDTEKQGKITKEIKASIDRLWSEADALAREKTSSKIEIDELLVKKDSLGTKIENQLGALEEKKTTFMTQIASLESELTAATKRLESLIEEVKETKEELAIQERFEKEKAEEVHWATLEIERLKNEENILKTSIMVLEKEIREEKGAGADSKEKYSDLWHPISFPTLQPIEGILVEKEALERTARYIQGQKLQFHQRTLHAFHTALKVSDISPIVVLAGISGTGKSELPRRYAEGMGLHFVILPVQPRWDSPQDLFGFYNYLESRYKATELARAMVQFEQYNSPYWPLPEGWNHDRSDRMLLVLLDEMNLARVEFYFSEFLSRLETRRGLDQKDEKQRAKAEIALEMGSLSEDETAIKLFPGNNILFSGTMNEDETTQALSDKVLDRSCVLRFGRPKKFSKREFNAEMNPREQGITFEQWNSWVNKESLPDDQEQVNEWINQLNEAMEQLDRPFGHRVAQAIQSYVANYPAWVSNRLRNAMADQIEQRILPKLRGIEISEAMDAIRRIGSVIEACEDQELLDAFKRGHSDDQIFIWRGIDRMED